MTDVTQIFTDAVLAEYRDRLNQYDSRMPTNLVIASVDQPGFGIPVPDARALHRARIMVGDNVLGVPIYYRLGGKWEHYT